MKRLLRAASQYPALGMGAAIVTLAVLIAVLAPLLWTADPTAIDPIHRLRDPSKLNWFGTDALGRDSYSRIVYGTRVTLVIGASVATLTMVAGGLIGTLAGYIRWLDSILMRVMDAILSVPPILLAIAMVALWRGSIWNVMIAITIAETPRMARLVRSVVLVLRNHAYIEAATVAGNKLPRVIARHILPNAIPAMSVQATYVCAAAMIIEAILSFLGAGTPSTTPSWGNIMADGRTLLQLKPLLVFIPACCLSITVLGVNLLGDGLRDFLDPKFVREG